jgi:membrane-bound lytic murein transglycosylase D
MKDCGHRFRSFTIFKALDMNNKRLLLLGIIIVLGVAWIHPITQTQGSENEGNHSLSDTERVAASPNIVSDATSSDSQNDFKELFVAATVGGSNGVRLNPRALSFVQDYMKENWDDLQDIRNHGRVYFNIIENILTEYGLPKELKYLAVIESNLKSGAVSKAGAAGPWQLMPQTARDLGLKVTRGNDERKNYYKSTRAAALYLRDLYNELGDWLLVIAAYNGGTNNVYHAIHRSGSRNFWDLQYFLPLESRLHVKKFIGTQYTFEGQGSVTTLTKQEATEQLSGSSMYVFHRKLSPEELDNARTIAITGKYHSTIIARYTLLDMATFSRYNPEFDKVMASSNNSYDLKLPANKMELFAANKYEILNESAQLLDGDEPAHNGATVGQVAVK